MNQQPTTPLPALVPLPEQPQQLANLVAEVAKVFAATSRSRGASWWIYHQWCALRYVFGPQQIGPLHQGQQMHHVPIRHQWFADALLKLTLKRPCQIGQKSEALHGEWTRQQIDQFARRRLPNAVVFGFEEDALPIKYGPTRQRLTAIDRDLALRNGVAIGVTQNLLRQVQDLRPHWPMWDGYRLLPADDAVTEFANNLGVH